MSVEYYGILEILRTFFYQTKMIDTATDPKQSEIGIPLMRSVSTFLETFRQRCTEEEQALELELEKVRER